MADVAVNYLQKSYARFLEVSEHDRTSTIHGVKNRTDLGAGLPEVDLFKIVEQKYCVFYNNNNTNNNVELKPTTTGTPQILQALLL